ncbi:MAG TPA: T9SS type B sorting domain-containing protein [Saprospiraceae bacterium]|nr:T9SS type B sorting domain-containing protein [Saprospiraceae bacterium]
MNKLYYLVLFIGGLITAPSAFTHAQAQEKCPQSKLQFVENKGQWADNINYKADLGVGYLFLEDTRLTFFLIDGDYLSSRGHHHDWNPFQTVQCHAYNINFLDASAKRTYRSARPKQSYRNYFIGKDPSRWASLVGEFKQIIYENIFDGIDFQTYGSGSQLKYDFILQPGADVSSIQLEYDGVDDIYLRKNKLHISTSVNEIIEQEPYAFQEINGQKITVPCRFTLTNQVVGFDFPQGYDAKYPVTIDPTLVFASYTGSSSDNWGFSATYDAYGNLYGAGASFDPGYPVTTGAFQTTFGGHATDIALSKFTPTGDQLIYSTYIGGDKTEIPHSLMTNSFGQLVLFGTTSSDDYPVSLNAYDPTFNGGVSATTSSGLAFVNGSDIVITVFNESGSDIIGSTYVGGTDNDGLNFISFTEMNYGDDARGEVFVDKDNNIYVGTTTYSTDFPTTPGVFGPSFNLGQKDGCLVKMSFNLSSMIWGTYLGGSHDDGLFSLKVAENGDIFTCGYTKSTDFPTTAGVIHPDYQGGVSDGYITKINPNATKILASSYLGTNNEDRAYFLDFDSDNYVYVTGQSPNGQYPVTSGVYSNAGSSQFIHKLSNDLKQTGFSTIFGNGNGDRELSPSAFMVDLCNRIYFSGWGGGTNHGSSLINSMPITSDAIQTTTDGSDFYFIVFKENAASLEYASYFGGNLSREHVDGGTSRFDKSGTIYQAVCAGCGGNSDFPTSPGAYSQSNNANNCNLGVIKFNFEQPLVIAKGLPSPSFSGCVPFDVSFLNLSLGATDYIWDFGDNTTSTLENPTHTFNQTGNFNVMLIATGSGACNTVDTTFMNVSVLGNNETHIDSIEACNDNLVHLLPSFGISGASYEWSNGSSQFSVGVNTPGTYWVKTSLAGCNYIDTFYVVENPFGGSTYEELRICDGDSLTLAAKVTSDNYYFEWNQGGYDATITTDSPGVYWVNSFSNACVHTDSFNVQALPSYTFNESEYICEGDSLLWQGQYYYSDTTASVTFSSVNGCDSLHQLEVITRESYANTTVITTCPNIPFILPDGTTTENAGTFDSYLSTVYGCDSIETTILSFYPVTGYLQVIEDSVAVKLGYSEHIHIATNLADSLHWTPAIYLDCDDCTSVSVTPYHTTEYFISSIDQYGCQYVDSVTVYVDATKNVFIPNAFSPNGDGANDLFRIFTDKGVDAIPYLKIYDRWGNLVYWGKDLRPNDSSQGWDGTFKGRKLDPAVFVYVTEVSFLNGEKGVFSGDVTLVR